MSLKQKIREEGKKKMHEESVCGQIVLYLYTSDNNGAEKPSKFNEIVKILLIKGERVFIHVKDTIAEIIQIYPDPEIVIATEEVSEEKPFLALLNLICMYIENICGEKVTPLSLFRPRVVNNNSGKKTVMAKII